MKKLLPFIWSLFLALGCSEKNQEVLNIAVASNLRYPLDSIVEIFQSKEGISCKLTSNSSGMLTAQIEKGAPFDIFISANKLFSNRLMEKKISDSVNSFALGQLYLVFTKNHNYKSLSECFHSPEIKRIGIADERTAPFGLAAQQVIQKDSTIKNYSSKLILGESVSQVDQYLITNAVNAAFTSSSFLTKFGTEYRSIKINDQLYDPIEQSVVILNKGKLEHVEECQKFVDFLYSKTGQDILIHFGYKVNT